MAPCLGLMNNFGWTIKASLPTRCHSGLETAVIVRNFNPESDARPQQRVAGL